MSERVWFITGASRGFGREWTRAALARGERVAATVRDLTALDELVAEHGDAILPLKLDVREREGCVAAVESAWEHFGRLDVLVNNAGYAQIGMVEEVSEQDVRDVLATNFLGAVWTIQAALPHLRAQGSGHIISVSSVGGILAFSGMGFYNASKWALEGLTESLSYEVEPFGIHVTLIEPGGFETDSVASARVATPLDAYGPIYESARQRQAERRRTLGDAAASAEALFQIVDAEKPPLRVFFGGMWLETATGEYERRLANWREWQKVAETSEGVPIPGGAVL